jgi:hypothetical protein
MPDGVVLADGREAAVEVELTQKSRRRAEAIMRELVARYEAVWCFVTPTTRRTVERGLEAVGANGVQVLPLPGEPS